METSSRGEEMAVLAASIALFSPLADPIPMRAVPESLSTLLISAKSKLIVPAVLIMSAIPSTACLRTSSTILKASLTDIFLSITERSLSFGIAISASTSFSNSTKPPSAIEALLCPSKKKGLVTMATVKIPSSLAALAIIGAAPVAVPPPIPQAMKTISAPFTAS